MHFASVCGEVCWSGMSLKVGVTAFGEVVRRMARQRSGQKVIAARSSMVREPVVMKMALGLANLSKRVKSSSLTSKSSGRVSMIRSAERMADSMDWVRWRLGMVEKEEEKPDWGESD